MQRGGALSRPEHVWATRARRGQRTLKSKNGSNRTEKRGKTSGQPARHWSFGKATTCARLCPTKCTRALYWQNCGPASYEYLHTPATQRHRRLWVTAALLLALPVISARSACFPHPVKMSQRGALCCGEGCLKRCQQGAQPRVRAQCRAHLGPPPPSQRRMPRQQNARSQGHAHGGPPPQGQQRRPRQPPVSTL